MVNILIAYGWGSYHPSVFLLVDLKNPLSLPLSLSFSQLRTRFEFLIILFWIPQPALLCSFSFVLCSFSKTRAQGIPDSVLLNFSLSFLWFVLFFSLRDYYWSIPISLNTCIYIDQSSVLASFELKGRLVSTGKSDQIPLWSHSSVPWNALLGNNVCLQVLRFGVKWAPQQFPPLNWSPSTTLEWLWCLHSVR